MAEEKTAEEEAEVVDAVIVVRTVSPDGSVTAEVASLQGNVQLDQVQTILELAVRRWRQRIGLVG